MILIDSVMRALVRSMLRPHLGHVMKPPRHVTPTSFRSTDGSSLEGAVMHAARCPARGVVVFCHPLQRRGYHFFLRTGMAEWAAHEGYHGVLFNFKGFGRSEFGGIRFANDVIGAVGFARAQYPDLPVHLVGLSFGGFHAAQALRQLDGAIARVVLDSVPPHLGHVFRSGPPALLFKALGRSPWAEVTGTRTLSTCLAGAPHMPLLVLYGARDELCSAEDLRELELLARVELLPGCGHINGFVSNTSYRTLALAHLTGDPRLEGWGTLGLRAAAERGLLHRPGDSPAPEGRRADRAADG